MNNPIKDLTKYVWLFKLEKTWTETRFWELADGRKMRAIVQAEEKDKEEILRLYKTQLGREFCPWDETYPGEKEIEFDLSYERLDATDKQLELMNCTVGYQIKFQSNAQVDAEVMIKLPVENARKSATFFQKKLFGDIEILQTVMVDDAGYAHFYLSSVDKKTVYLIGIDVPDVTPSEAIIPEPLYQEYNISQEVSEVEYVVTGRTSSWGMSINQVTLFLVIGMVTAIVIVGCVMYGLNKRKLRMGYVPDLDDDEDEE